MYSLGAYEVAVIELSVGAGLVTVLFVFAISLTGEEALSAHTVVPQLLVLALVVGLFALLGLGFGRQLPATNDLLPVTGDFATTLWHDRGLDVLVQVGLIFAGVMGVLGLLAEQKQLVWERFATQERQTGKEQDKDLVRHPG